MQLEINDLMFFIKNLKILYRHLTYISLFNFVPQIQDLLPSSSSQFNAKPTVLDILL